MIPSNAEEKEDANGGKAYMPPENSMEILGSSTVIQPRPGPVRDADQHDSPNIQRHRSRAMERIRFATRDDPSTSAGVRPESANASAAADAEPRVETNASEYGENVVEQHERDEGAVHARPYDDREQARAEPEPRVEADASESEENLVDQRERSEDAVSARSCGDAEQPPAEPELSVEADASEAEENYIGQDDGAEGDGCSAVIASNAVAEAAAERIRELLSAIPVDLEKLRNVAWEPGGYQTDELRTKTWAKLLNLDRSADVEDFRDHLETPHSMTNQIQRDIDRSLTHFAHVRRWKRQRQQSKREKLRDVINSIIRKYDGVLNYYQGYHDVVTTLLLVTGDDHLTYALAERISLYFFRDCMRADFGVLTYLMHVVPVVIRVFDPELASFVSKSKVEPYYCMAWVLTWFAHDLSDLHVVARLYDVLLSGHPTLILYVCAAVTIYVREDVLACECEFSAVHNSLARAAKRVTDWEAVLQKTKGMFLKCPPGELVLRAPAYIRETLSSGGVTALEYPPPWFIGTSLSDWILLEETREKEGKGRITKAARQWHRAARQAGGENPEAMLTAYLEGGSGGRPGSVLKGILKRLMARVRLRRPREWRIATSPTAAFISTAVVIGAVTFSYHLSSRQQIGTLP